jgi:glutamate/tyrosine decarboxylase-like PLP-dependent enzyme
MKNKGSQNPVFKENVLGDYRFKGYGHIPGIEGHFQTRADYGKDEITGWFLGTKAENKDIFLKYIEEAIQIISYGRKRYHSEDPSYITEHKKATEGYRAAMQSLNVNFYRLISFLNEYSIPFYSMRYQGHMLWDMTLPSMIGYFTEMLQNSNHVSTQASAATIVLEQLVTRDICKMIAYGTTREDLQKKIMPWGHITCDGSVANLEAMWSARELKFLPLGIKEAILHEKDWEKAKNIAVTLPDGREELLLNLNNWQLLNITCDESLTLPEKIAFLVYQPSNENKCSILNEIWAVLKESYSVNAIGMAEIVKKYLQDIKAPAVVVPSSKHYSWPKAVSVLGLGKCAENLEQSGLINVFVDTKARMDMNLLKQKLWECVKLQKPILMVVAVIGSTEESAVDPLKEIWELRNQFRKMYNFDFNIHCDAAWGGYVTSVIRKDYDLEWPKDFKDHVNPEEPFLENTEDVPLSQYVIEQFKHIRYSDSITIDPHKMGFVPYPAGTISYRNQDVINLITYSAPYIGGGDVLSALGQSGIEGSRPGAAASAIFLSHSVIRPSVKGHGKIVSLGLKNTRQFLSLIREIDKGCESDFIVVPLPTEEEDGPDINLVDYAFNFKDENGKLNTEIKRFNEFNQRIFNYHNIMPGEKADKCDLFITMTTFKEDEYGGTFTDALIKRIGLSYDSRKKELNYLRSVIMDPWMADTFDQDNHINFFEEVIIPTLRKTVLRCVREMREMEK